MPQQYGKRSKVMATEQLQNWTETGPEQDRTPSWQHNKKGKIHSDQ